MSKNKVCAYAGKTVMLTSEGRLFLAYEAIIAAKTARSAQKRKRLCEEATNHLQAFVRTFEVCSASKRDYSARSQRQLSQRRADVELLRDCNKTHLVLLEDA